MMLYEQMRVILDALGCAPGCFHVSPGGQTGRAFDHATEHAKEILGQRTPPPSVPFCFKCAHYYSEFMYFNGRRIHLCRHPAFHAPDLVTGLPTQIHCYEEREPHGRCGKEGRLFTAKPTEESPCSTTTSPRS